MMAFHKSLILEAFTSFKWTWDEIVEPDNFSESILSKLKRR